LASEKFNPRFPHYFSVFSFQLFPPIAWSCVHCVNQYRPNSTYVNSSFWLLSCLLFHIVLFKYSDVVFSLFVLYLISVYYEDFLLEISQRLICLVGSMGTHVDAAKFQVGSPRASSV
jgi:hypothetical protein